jgi:uncharacterized protein HemX
MRLVLPRVLRGHMSALSLSRRFSIAPQQPSAEGASQPASLQGLVVSVVRFLGPGHAGGRQLRGALREMKWKMDAAATELKRASEATAAETNEATKRVLAEWEDRCRDKLAKLAVTFEEATEAREEARKRARARWLLALATFAVTLFLGRKDVVRLFLNMFQFVKCVSFKG